MKVVPCKFVWMDGELVPWEKATVHVATHALHYGSGVFSGGRCYVNKKSGPVIFRLQDHVQRLVESCQAYGMRDGEMGMQFDADQLAAAIKETVEANGMALCYIRPLIFRGCTEVDGLIQGELGVCSLGTPVRVVIFVQDWGQYVGGKGGAKVCISHWRRMRDDMMPMTAKCIANYANGQLIKNDAIRRGYHEGIALTHDGFLSEGSGENIFLVQDGIIYTPDLGSSILNGIMRRTVITLADELGLEVREQRVPLSMLTTADEVFFTGSAAEVTPIGQIGDNIIKQVSGPVVTAIRKRLFGIITEGTFVDDHHWLTRIKL